MPHSDFIAFFVQEHIQGIQLNIGIQTNGEKSWHQSYNYPRLGIGFHRSGLGNREVYGNMNAVFAYVDRYYLNWKNKFNFGNRLSLGTAYVSKKFDLETNNTNLAIGSRYNAYINYSFEAIFKVFPKTEMKVGAGVTHISNGSFRQPNKGLNSFTAFTGITYKFNEPTLTKVDVDEPSSKHQFFLMTSFGRKQISRRYNYSYTVLALTGEYSHLIVGNSWGGAAISLYHDPSLEKELQLGNDSISTSFSDRLRVSLNLSYELRMGKVSYVFQPGFYLRNPYKQPGSISNKLSVRYHINPRLTAALTIKAHWFAIADFFEWGIGYKLGK
jgi:hypothetical protein